MSGQGPDSRLADRVWQALILAALLPIAVAGLGELLGWGIRGVPYGDYSIIELQILRAARGQQLLGPASRFGWNHPGPLYFYLLAPLYVLAKLQRWSLFFGTGIVNLVCGYGFLRSCFRQVRAAAVRLAVLGGFGVYLAASGKLTELLPGFFAQPGGDMESGSGGARGPGRDG